MEPNDFFNEVSGMTAVFKSRLTGKQYPELELGKQYSVSHIGVLRSCTYIVLSGIKGKYNAARFDLYENGVALNDNYTHDTRFWAPCLRKLYKNRLLHT